MLASPLRHRFRGRRSLEPRLLAGISQRTVGVSQQQQETGGLTPTVRQSEETGGLTPTVRQSKETGGLTPTVRQSEETGGLTPTVRQSEETGGLTPTVRQSELDGQSNQSSVLAGSFFRDSGRRWTWFSQDGIREHLDLREDLDRSCSAL
jgi:hypothetical protein